MEGIGRKNVATALSGFEKENANGRQAQAKLPRAPDRGQENEMRVPSLSAKADRLVCQFSPGLRKVVALSGRGVGGFAFVQAKIMTPFTHSLTPNTRGSLRALLDYVGVEWGLWHM